MKNNIMKALTIVFWVLFLAAITNVIAGPSGFWLTVVGVVLLLAHAIELVVFAKAIEAKGDGRLKSFLMTMIYGVFYFKF